MHTNTIGKEEWINMFREIGLGDADMERWHRIFEHRHADAHQSFLAWLNIPPQEIQMIRARSAQL
ncbi:MAG: hypothetical protein HQL90_05350 [Magnetococcales bacterium]|nr:hypothetical protein [Magnetococcales bacterium]